jgi:hypothetical protein
MFGTIIESWSRVVIQNESSHHIGSAANTGVSRIGRRRKCKIGLYFTVRRPKAHFVKKFALHGNVKPSMLTVRCPLTPSLPSRRLRRDAH